MSDTAAEGASASADIIPHHSISLAAGRRVLDVASAKAVQLGRAVCINVCDPSGEPVITARMDGASRTSAQIASDKAWTVASFGGLPTHRWWPMIEDDPALVHGITKTPRLVIFAGGIALRADGAVDGAVVGAIGVSGASSDEDRAVAEAGAAALARPS